VTLVSLEEGVGSTGGETVVVDEVSCSFSIGLDIDSSSISLTLGSTPDLDSRDSILDSNLDSMLVSRVNGRAMGGIMIGG